MAEFANIKSLKTSWTKYDIVRIIEIVAHNELDLYLDGTKSMDKPILLASLGIKNRRDRLPDFWIKIQCYPDHVRLFTLIAIILSHHKVIEIMASFATKGSFSGTYKYKNEKLYTNLRSALIVSDAALEKLRANKSVRYTLAALYEVGEIGILVKELITNRLKVVGYDEKTLNNNASFIEICDKHQIIDALALKKDQFKEWISGVPLDVEKSTFSIKKLKIHSEIPMLRVNQWMHEWDDINFNIEEQRRKPNPYFYTFSIDARLLKRLSDVHRRNEDRDAIQRRKSDARVKEITNYVEGGFPWSTLQKESQKPIEHVRLKMPGFLPTSIILNILAPGATRNGKTINSSDCLTVIDKSNDSNTESNHSIELPRLMIPDDVFTDQWNPELKPIEIIDGQHRLWAFDEKQHINGSYDLPVIAFYNLDRAWQAYLFYTINIKPVKINTSLGFDLYPMLRTQQWLEHSKNGILAYRENRAQELVETLWLYPNSPWYDRINMLGETGGPAISQSAFIRSLINSFFRQTKGLYASEIGDNHDVLNWNRTQQAAFLILIWDYIETALLGTTDLHWANMLRDEEYSDNDQAFEGKNTFLNRDQGVRPIMTFANDFFFTLMERGFVNLNNFTWDDEVDERSIDNNSIDIALDKFREDTILCKYVELFAKSVIKIDWRTPSAYFDDETERKRQLIYKGSGGYTEFYKELKYAFEQSDEPLLTPVISTMFQQGQ